MPLFVCSRCNCIENTALGYYWGRKSMGEPIICSECETGKWHNKFPKEKFNEELEYIDGDFVARKKIVNK